MKKEIETINYGGQEITTITFTFESTGRSIEDNLFSIGDGPEFRVFEGYDAELEAIKPESEWRNYKQTLKNGQELDCLDDGSSPLTTEEKIELTDYMITLWTVAKNFLSGKWTTVKKTNTIEMDYTELEKIVLDHYGVEFDFVAAQECGNDSYHLFVIDGKEEIDNYNKSIMDQWLKGEDQPWPQTVLQDLVNQDVLQPGRYLISVCW